MAGRTTSPFAASQGVPLMLRDGQDAARNFKISSNNTVFTNNALIPRPKFLFFVKFVQAIDNAGGIGPSVSDTNRYSDPAEGIVFQIKTIDKPKFNIKTETLHQYNKKRVIQTMIDYQPMTITFHDDVSDHVIKFWQDYYRYYYGDGDKFNSNQWREDIVANEFDDTTNTGWGYLGNFSGGDAHDRNFLERIELYQFYGGEYTRIDFVHPKITVFDHDANDYADGREGQGIRISFDYEGVIYDLKNNKITTEQEQAFNFSNEYFDLGASGANARTDGARDTLVNRGIGITSSRPAQRAPTPGTDRFRKQISTAALTLPNVGKSILGRSNFSFGTEAISGVGNRNVDFSELTYLSGQAPLPDSVEKATGIQITTDNFGQFKPPTNSNSAIDWFDTSETTNTGFSSTEIDTNAARLRGRTSPREIQLGEGESTLTITQRTTEDQAQILATGGQLAKNEGVITTIIITGDPEEFTQGEDALVKLGSTGRYRLTEKGAASMNAMRADNSVLGINLENFDNISQLDLENLSSFDRMQLAMARTSESPDE